MGHEIWDLGEVAVEIHAVRGLEKDVAPLRKVEVLVLHRTQGSGPKPSNITERALIHSEASLQSFRSIFFGCFAVDRVLCIGGIVSSSLPGRYKAVIGCAHVCKF